MSLSVPRDTSNSPQSASLAAAPQGSAPQPNPFRRLLNAVLVEAYGEMVRQSLEELKRTRYLNARLQYYETHVPWLTELRRKFDAENAGLNPNALTDGVFVPENGQARKHIIELTS
jgi:leucyl aminopeptidase (aminopeptidase T)